jgi:hypothetical protein
MGDWKSLKIDNGTGWKEINRVSGASAWKPLLWEVDVGEYFTATATGGANRTYVAKYNPSNENSYLSNIKFSKQRTGDLTLYFGSFYVVSGNTLKCRDVASETFSGTGQKNLSCEIEIHAGDYIGAYDMYYIAYSSSGGGLGGIWYETGNKCVVDLQTAFASQSSRSCSMLGT